MGCLASDKTDGGAEHETKVVHALATWPALVGWLGIGISGASAQSVYIEPYGEPYPVVEPYP
jgi:hypothetical protein